MKKDLTQTRRGNVAIYNPEKGLLTILAAEAGEKHWRRAKDATQLCKAIDTKIDAQADYAVWRDGAVEENVKPKRSGKGGKISARKSYLPAADPGNVVAHRWRKKLTSKNGKVTVRDEAAIAKAKNDAKHRAVRICEQEKDGTIRGTEGTGEFERYTPAFYIEAVRKALGEIDLDPATSKQAQKIVKAAQYFVEKDNGLAHEWHGRVFLNPPYHRELAPKFIEKLVTEFDAGRVQSAVVLTNNSTDTDWFDVAMRDCASICFTHGRIQFTVPNGDKVLPTQGQAFFYFGDDAQRFEDVFCVIGFCMRPSREYESNGVNRNDSVAVESRSDESAAEKISA
jgi:phage N-6-adenine-methyltransferase